MAYLLGELAVIIFIAWCIMDFWLKKAYEKKKGHPMTKNTMIILMVILSFLISLL